MCGKAKTVIILASVLALWSYSVSSAFANGGPFVIKYPNGDPAAKGVLSRLGPDLKPGRESRLRVIKEDLKVIFDQEWRPKSQAEGPPVVRVSAEYNIENPTREEIEVDFGFPILRGMYISPLAMMPRPDVQVRLGNKPVKCTIISNSAIYGIIRQRARKVIEDAIANDSVLKKLVASIRDTNQEACEAARKVLRLHLIEAMNWNERDAALMLEYASIDFRQVKSRPPDRTRWLWATDKGLNELMNSNLGPLSAIGEQKATQFFAQLACCFDPKASATYEAIFTAWGGDVRERSVDLATGKVRPREITVDNDVLNTLRYRGTDLTIYARVDYLDPQAKISESEKASCKAILKNLPVVFTFAPMNILHYQVKFPAKSTQTLTVSYSQFAYLDTRPPSSYQLAYVVHPASLWKYFGPINLEVAVPEGIYLRASIPCSNGGIEERSVRRFNNKKGLFNIYRGEVEQRTGEIYLAIDADAWRKFARQISARRLSDRFRQVAQGAN